MDYHFLVNLLKGRMHIKYLIENRLGDNENCWSGQLGGDEMGLSREMHENIVLEGSWKAEIGEK